MKVAQSLSVMTSAAETESESSASSEMHGVQADLSLLLLSNSDITRSLTLLKVRGMRNISNDTISIKLFAIGVPVNSTLRRQLRESRRLSVESKHFWNGTIIFGCCCFRNWVTCGGCWPRS